MMRINVHKVLILLSKYSFIHSFIPRLPIRRSGALQQTSYGSPPTCSVLASSTIP